MARTPALLLTVVALLVACGPSEAATPTPPPYLGCPQPSRVVFGNSPFDTENLASWKKDLEADTSCDSATAAYVKRLEVEKEKQLFANASTFAIIGRVTDAATGTPLEQVCVTAGKPGSICWSRTDKDGWYLLDIGAVGGQPGFFEIFFVKEGYPEQHNTSRMLSSRARLDYQMTK